ncbi:acetyl-CoA hydrolase/transferase C-terminal domain-containing protein [Roseinatronobacter alkalisoli]|uniref:Acetyl-CoA hydrolase/transferase C-terminal domain-containing protein n=1 Tax=Roseinatronobacter alkalisoli TaxID=3028235 RepID=A0ABT5TCC5_9RHOB|nr:acetyl-CoA hydrolase/transferase C-terminal domain-containing protein [Roseinatronobacter sp. HJB301]MDD7972775.1 acetyl-CoA hydrolase/transferase C-terminal domain-containing protein [Roseinatronobacter sp. HJB301]
MREPTAHFTSDEPVVDWILATLGHDLRVGLPLGLGKPVTLINALVRRACDDPTIRLRIFTALTLERPTPSSDMERRFLEPALDRLFGDYPQIEYARLLRAGELPENIQVTEFFLQAPNWVKVPQAQQNYVSANYTHALDVLLKQKPNLILQLLAGDGGRLSLSCNPDITSDLLRLRKRGDAAFTFIGQVHAGLPFMPGPAEIDVSECAALLTPDAAPHALFSVVKRPVSLRDHAIALHVSRLIRDGGTIQIGIGQIGDAIANALTLRQDEQIAPLWQSCPFPHAAEFNESGPFRTGLYGLTEMLVDGLLALFERGIIRRDVDGAAIHAGFFLDSRDFYDRLKALPAQDRARIAMVPVSYTNSLLGDEPAKRAARADARFINSAMMVTLLGAVISDGTEDGKVVSGVGGQFNFVDQAFALKDARAIITLPATRHGKSGLTSNIRFSYGHVTIPRHMRDIVVTEYGIADLRGKSDADTIAALLEIADSRFQQELENEAKESGKLPASYRLPDTARKNTPKALRNWLEPYRDGSLPDFPFGTDFTDIEQYLLPVLADLRRASAHIPALLALTLRGLRGNPARREDEALDRMALAQPDGIRARAAALALRGALRRHEDPASE